MELLKNALLKRNSAKAEDRGESVGRLDYDSEDVQIYVDSPVEQRRLYPCAKEPDTVEWIHRYIHAGDSVFDVGANVGVYSLIIGKHLKGQVRVFAFEPAWFNFMQLNRNVILNQLQECVFPVNLALFNREGVGWFNYSSLEYGSALHSFDETTDDFGEPFKPVYKQPVATSTLDRFVENLGIPVPNHIKIDVDGAEAQVIKGAGVTLANPALKSVHLELNSRLEGDIQVIDLLRNHGFTVVNKLSRLEAKQKRFPGRVLEEEKWGKYRDLANFSFVRV